MTLKEQINNYEIGLQKLEKNIEIMMVRYSEIKKENEILNNQVKELTERKIELSKEKIERDKELGELRVQFDKIKGTQIFNEKERQTYKERISEILEKIDIHLKLNNV